MCDVWHWTSDEGQWIKQHEGNGVTLGSLKECDGSQERSLGTGRRQCYEYCSLFDYMRAPQCQSSHTLLSRLRGTKTYVSRINPIWNVGELKCRSVVVSKLGGYFDWTTCIDSTNNCVNRVFVAGCKYRDVAGWMESPICMFCPLQPKVHAQNQFCCFMHQS